MNQFEVKQYEFTSDVLLGLNDNFYAKNYWPLVYILSDEKVKEAYIGETTDVTARMAVHLKSEGKKKLTTVHFISSDKFNKSATLDIESNLIRYISADGNYKLLNGNVGLANHSYYQKKELYWDMFTSIWNGLRAEGVTKHSIEYIDNSDLFKYSPYKSLTADQQEGLMSILKSINDEAHRNVIVDGGAGTGKTILAIFLFKLLTTDGEDFNFQEFGDGEIEIVEQVKHIKNKLPQPKMALVVPMSSFRKTLKKVFKNIKGLKPNMVIGPSEASKHEYDIIIVDESHRLRQRTNLGTYFGVFDKTCERLGLDKNNSNELEWMIKQSKKTILFYDESQSIKPSDVDKKAFDELKSDKSTRIEKLKSQFRVKGGNAYVDFIEKLLSVNLPNDSKVFKNNNYDFFLFEDLEDMVSQVKRRDNEYGLSRLIAGYSWPWDSKKDSNLFDIEIGTVKLKWNNTAEDWINSDNAVNEVGCIHTTQGYDLNYAAIIFGKEIVYDKRDNQIKIIRENYLDKNGKQTVKEDKELKSFILNIYKTILLRGIKGTYVYAFDEGLREYLSRYISIFGVESSKPTIVESSKELIPFENSIPLYDLNVAAGNFSELQDVHDYDWISLPHGYKPSEDLFACKIVGESMNKVVQDGDICLFRKYTGGTRNGKIVLVEYTNMVDKDFGSCYTIKEYRSFKEISSEGWEHSSILLMPLSYDESYKPIQLDGEEVNYFRVIGLFEKVIKSANI